MGYQITLLYGYADSDYGMMHTFKVLDAKDKITDEIIDELAGNIELTSDDDEFDWDRTTLELPAALIKRICEENVQAARDCNLKIYPHRAPQSYWIHTTTEDDWGGTSHKWTCANCGSSTGHNPAGSHYCDICGARMDGNG